MDGGFKWKNVQNYQYRVGDRILSYTEYLLSQKIQNSRFIKAKRNTFLSIWFFIVSRFPITGPVIPNSPFLVQPLTS